MPFLYENTIQNTRYAVWEVAESSAFFIENLPSSFIENNSEYAGISHEKIKIQWLASRFLWYKMTSENPDFFVEKDAFGKPYLCESALHYSVSHSGAFVAVVESDTFCGIDIQIPTLTIDKIAHRVMHESDWRELERHGLDTTLFWSAKEAIFKAWTVGGLAGKNIRLHGFSQKQTMKLETEETQTNSIEINNIQTKDTQAESIRAGQLLLHEAAGSVVLDEEKKATYTIFYEKNAAFTLAIAIKQVNLSYYQKY